MTFGSLFAGIGGFDLGFERAGMTCRWQVEIEEYQRAVLARHWPDAERWDDVRTFPPAAGDWKVDVICGGFPCQDISVASNTGDGLDGERSGLWTEYLRIIRHLRPRYVVVENSAAILFRGMDRVLGDLAGIGFDAEWRVFSAFEFGAPHERERLYLAAYPHEVDGQTGLGNQQDRTPKVFTSRPGACLPLWLQATDQFIGMDDGVRGWAYRNRVECVGNAVVPQIAEWIGRRLVSLNL
jgi:DNA (cytosine-5)-methyltransferase 1